jgi:hypothetical protein
LTAVYDVLAGLPGDREGRVWPASEVRTAFENAVADPKLDDVHFHDVRHHFASWYIMRGGSLPALQQILGHADIKMTLRYAHLSPDHLGPRSRRPSARRRADCRADHARDHARGRSGRRGVSEVLEVAGAGGGS